MGRSESQSNNVRQQIAPRIQTRVNLELHQGNNQRPALFFVQQSRRVPGIVALSEEVQQL
jgi:hypothetical protein